ncbi:Formyltetrahydrofolate deformylase [Exophiala dermatitidis]
MRLQITSPEPPAIFVTTATSEAAFSFLRYEQMILVLRAARHTAPACKTLNRPYTATSAFKFARLSVSVPLISRSGISTRRRGDSSFPFSTSTATSTATLQAVKMANDHILTLSCPDKPGIVHAVTGIFANNSLNILDLQQFSDRTSEKFFMRVHFGPAEDTAFLKPAFDSLAAEIKMEYELRPVATKPKVLIMVSKIGHCLNDLLFRQKTGQLSIEVPVIVSNHPDFEPLARSYGIAFHHLPVTKDTKADQERRILELIRENDVDLVVLARYMQVLSPTLCEAMSGKIINIHHSFLPSFKGAKPYHQAYERGVKIIGATAHFVTADLDEGPIIEQRVARVDHSMTPKELVDEGSNVESQVLAAAVKWWSEKRVFLNGTKTVVFN